MPNYKREPDELRGKASLYWPCELARREATASIIPILIATQDKFISLLDVSDSSPVVWKSVLSSSDQLYPNLFLKHLMVLSDIGGEPLKRLRPELASIFPSGKMRYIWHSSEYEYQFQEILHTSQLGNVSLFVDGEGLLQKQPINCKLEDVMMLLLHGAASVEPVPDIIRERCVIGNLIGKKAELESFVKQRYIWVSRITGGATANKMGQLAQDYVKELLEQKLPDWQFIRNGSISGISQNEGRTDISFDIVAHSPSDKYAGIEVAFQFTTNSVIERKAGQARSRMQLLHEAGHRIAYVIDGAGNFERVAALTTICQFSDCTVALTQSEIEVLVAFLKEIEV